MRNIDYAPPLCHYCNKMAIGQCKKCDNLFCEECLAAYNNLSGLEHDCCYVCADYFYSNLKKST